MNINTDNPIIKYSEEGKEFPYLKLFYATVNDYILEYKNARLEKLTDQDASICLARIIRKMEVNGVPVQQFFREELDSWTDVSNYTRVLRLCDMMSRDIFCCFDKNRYDEDGNFERVDRLYCVNNDGEKDFFTLEEYTKTGLFKKSLTPESEYFKGLEKKYAAGLLPTSK
ncbi:MAG: hypothetical protein IJ737_08005 [Ruminococcus sp.]|nr:hypothetical protein [Ruminococcus sp.]